MKTKIPVPLGDGTKVEVVSFEYKGRPVLTTKQLIKLFCCGNTVIRKCYYKHKEEFVKGTDFFKLERKELCDFRALARRNISYQSNLLGNCYQSNLLSNAEKLLDEVVELLKGPTLVLWTKTGVLKLSRRIDTDKAKVIYAALALGYFGADNFQPPTEENQRAQTSLFTTEETPKENTDKGSATDFSKREKFEILKDFIDKCTDDNLRNKLIREAAKLITGKDF